MDENSKLRGKIDDEIVTCPVEGGGMGILKEKNRYDCGDTNVVASKFLSDTIKMPFPPSVVARKRWHENYESWRTAPNYDLPMPELSSKIHEKLQLELEEAFLKVMALEGYEVSEEMMAELNRTFEEQKDRQERFKHHLRSSWQRPCPSGSSFGCCDRHAFTSK